jgi:hypothetical protein
MWNLIITTIVLSNNMIVSKESIIPDQYNTLDQCMSAVVVAQQYVDRVAKTSNTFPGRVSCRMVS